MFTLISLMQKNHFIVFIFITAVSFASAFAQKGSAFPNFPTKKLTGQTFILPDSVKGKFSIIGIAFSKKAEESLKTWYQPAYQTFIQKKKTMFASEVYNVNTYFDEASRIYLESAVPRTKLALINTLTIKKYEFFLRHTFFGTVTDPNTADVNGNGFVEGANINGQFLATEHPVIGGRTITDFSIGYKISNKITITAGANNIFDIYPDVNLKTQTAARPNTAGVYGAPGTIDLSNNNQFQYSRNVSQFGFNGRFIFTRLNISL